MRILHLYSGNLFGGIERVLLTLWHERAMIPACHQEFALGFDGPLKEQLTAQGATVHAYPSVRLSRPWQILRARRALRAWHAAKRFDVALVHSSWPHLIFTPLALSLGLPVVYWAHDRVQPKHWMSRLAARTPPTRVIANSGFTGSTVGAMFPGCPVDVVYCPSRLVGNEPLAATARYDLRELFDTTAEQVAILQPSRLEGVKGHINHLHGIARLPRDLPWVAWFAGHPQRPSEEVYVAELKSLAQSLGISDRIRWIGQRSDMPTVMQAADLICQPNSGPESFGLVFVEALNAGRPIVTANFGSAPELLGEGFGTLVEPNNPESLAQSLEHLIRNPHLSEEQIVRGRERARLIADPAIQLPKFEAVCRAAIQTRSGPLTKVIR